jgi:hypothetical protein
MNNMGEWPSALSIVVILLLSVVGTIAIALCAVHGAVYLVDHLAWKP